MTSTFPQLPCARRATAMVLAAVLAFAAGAAPAGDEATSTDNAARADKAIGADAHWRIVMQGNDAIAAPGLQWTASKTVPPGAKMVMIYGDPGKPGPYVFRVLFPAGYKLPAHRHEDQRSVTVLKGNYWSGVGESYEQAKLKKFGPRDFYITEARVPHFSWAETDVIIQEMGIGPVSNPIEYVNAAEDPRK